MNDIIRVTRVIVYEGERHWIEQTLAKSINGTIKLSEKRSIRVDTASSETLIADATPLARPSESFFVEVDKS